MTRCQPLFSHQHHHGSGRRTRRSADTGENGTGFNPLFQGMAIDPAKLADFRIRDFSPTLQCWV